MWFMPSWGRPERLRELLEAPGGWPHEVVVLINEDDPQRDCYLQVVGGLLQQYRSELASGEKPTWHIPWRLAGITPGSRCADAHRHITMAWPNEPFYGLLCDDHWPLTPGWHQALVEAAGDRCIATPAGEPLFPKIRNAVVLGGELVRAMGSLVPAPVKHNYEDNLWDQVAEDFHCLRPLPDVLVEHKHWMRGEADKDATYVRGSGDIDQDRQIFEDWARSQDRAEMNARIAKLFGMTTSSIDPKTVRLAIATPIQNEQVDVAYHKSLNETLRYLPDCGISVCVIEAAGGSHVGKARERVLWEAMKRSPTHILFVDADMGWEPRLVTRLLCADHEFSAIPGVKKQDEFRLCVNFLPQQRFHETTRFLEVRDVGFAFVMLKVSVIHKLCAAYPELRYNAGDQAEYGLFLDMNDKGDGEHGERLSEDLSFCRRWRAITGEIWVDTESAIIHAGCKEYTGRVSDLFTYEKPKLAAA
jgi:hypothetical protein